MPEKALKTSKNGQKWPKMAQKHRFLPIFLVFSAFQFNAVQAEDLKNFLSEDGTRLVVMNSSVTDADFAQLDGEEFSRIESVTIRSTNVTDAAAGHLARLPLRALALSETKIGPDGFAELRGLALRMLTVGRQKVTAQALMHLKDMPLSEGLLLISADITDQDLRELEGFEQVTLLNLSRTKVTGRGVLNMRAFPNLKSLYLYGIEISPETALQIEQKWPGLKLYLALD